MTGTVSAANGDKAAIPFTKISTGNLVVDLNDIEHGVPIDGTLKMTVNDKPATLAIKGTADAVENNTLITDPEQAQRRPRRDDRTTRSLRRQSRPRRCGKDRTSTSPALLKGKLTISAQPGADAAIRAEDNLGIDNLVVSRAAAAGRHLRQQAHRLPDRHHPQFGQR